MQVVAIVRLAEVRDWVAARPDMSAALAAIDAYRKEYGA
jgi:hypothetical protein